MNDEHSHAPEEHSRAMVRLHALLVEGVASTFSGPGTPQYERLVISIDRLARDLHDEGPDAIASMLTAALVHIGLDCYYLDLDEEQQYEMLADRVSHHMRPEEGFGG